MSLVPEGQLPALANALAKAYPTGPRASELFAKISENFDAITDPDQTHQDQISDAVADLQSRGVLLLLIDAALGDPQQARNAALRQVLLPIAQENRWGRLRELGLVLRDGPFVNRANLKMSINQLLLGRRALRIIGTGETRGRSWSSQLVERQASLRGAPYIHVDLRSAPPAGRETPT